MAVVYDILIYDPKEKQPPASPRRIVFDEYQIEWHREGIQFVKCPEGSMCNRGNPNDVIPIKAGDIVPWSRLNDRERYDIKPENGEPVLVIRAFYRKDFKDWIQYCWVLPDNFNTEMMWYIARCFEDSFSKKLSIKNIENICQELQQSLSQGVDDTTRDLIVNTWERRLEEKIVKDLFNEATIGDAKAHFKNLLLKAQK